MRFPSSFESSAELGLEPPGFDTVLYVEPLHLWMTEKREIGVFIITLQSIGLNETAKSELAAPAEATLHVKSSKSNFSSIVHDC